MHMYVGNYILMGIVRDKRSNMGNYDKALILPWDDDDLIVDGVFVFYLSACRRSDQMVRKIFVSAEAKNNFRV